MDKTLKRLSELFLKYVLKLDTEWVVNPFVRYEVTNLESEEEESLIGLRINVVYKGIFSEKELLEFWILINTE